MAHQNPQSDEKKNEIKQLILAGDYLFLVHVILFETEKTLH